MNPTRKTWYDKNNVPPTNYIWYKNGKYLENIDGKWVETSGANSGSGIKPDMTETEQMQARKDLGLYYEETTTGEKEVVSDGNSNTKLSSDVPAKDDILSLLDNVGEAVNFNIADIDDGYRVSTSEPGLSQLTVFAVKEDGIYTSEGMDVLVTAGYKLVYKAETTVISKVPDKYLPIAWNQLVTEGTKIAEVTIGDKTTNVFAPEGGGSLPWLEINDFLPNTGSNQNISSFISQTDYEKLVDGEYAGIHIIGNTSIMSQRDEEYLYCISSRFGIIDNTKSVFLARCYYLPDALLGDKNTLQIFTIFGNSVESVTITSPRVYIGDDIDLSSIPGPVTLSGLPTASMTTQAELDAIGLTNDVIIGMYSGNYTGIKYSDTSVVMNSKFVFAPFKTAQRTLSSGNVNTTLSFDILGNNYNIGIVQVVGGSTTVTVTVTPLT